VVAGRKGAHLGGRSKVARGGGRGTPVGSADIGSLAMKNEL
jgi:hypothetical protein